MRTALKTMYDQLEAINKQVVLIKKYEEPFSSVHCNDEHFRIVQALAIKSTSSLITIKNNITKLSNVMEVSFNEDLH